MRRPIAGLGRRFAACMLGLCSLGWTLVSATAQLPPGCKPPPQLEQAVAEAPSSDVYNALGAFFAQNKRPDCSMGAFKEALQLDPEDPATHFNLGLVSMQAGDLETAAAEFSQVTQLQPDMINGHLALGTALLELGRYSEASEPLEAALEIDLRSTQALDHLAQALMAQGDFPRAIAGSAPRGRTRTL